MYPTCILPRQKPATPPKINSCNLRINPEKEKENHLRPNLQFWIQNYTPWKINMEPKKIGGLGRCFILFQKVHFFFRFQPLVFGGQYINFRCYEYFILSTPLTLFHSSLWTVHSCVVFFRRQVARTHLLGIRFTSGDQPGWLRLEGISDQLGFIYPLRLAVFLGWGVGEYP